jgi:hypothetical protein
MHHLILLFFLSLSTIVEAQQVGDLFKAMPPELLPGVSEGNKTMLLVDSGKTTVPYPLGEIVKEAYGNDYLRLQTSKIGTLQLKLLPVSEDSVVVCLIKTVCGNVCDSHISFYTSEWKKLDKEAFLPTISAEIFLNSSQKKSKNDKYAVSLPDIYPISASFSETGTDLTLRFHYEDRLTDEQVQKLKPLLKGDSVVLKWDHATFR